MSSLAIPIEILNDAEISLNVKNFYATVAKLCIKKGYCWGSNEYFAEKFGRTVRTISKWVSELITHNYLTLEMIYADKKHKKNQRRLRLVNNSNTVSTSRYTWKNFYMPKLDSKHDKSDKASKKSPKVFNKSFNKDLYITSVFPTEKHIARAHARTSETKKYIAKKFDDKKRTPEGVLRVVEKNELSLKYNSTLEAQGARIHATKGYIFNAPKSIDATRVSEDTLSTVESIIKVLNQCASRHYKSDTQETLGFLIPLLKLGYKFTDFAKVITTKCRDWLGTPFAKYLRPKTLFRADNFAKYSNRHDQNSRGNWTCNQKVIQPRQNKFANFKQREWDFEKIEFLSQYDSASEEDLRRFEERRQARKAIERPKVENSRQNKFQNLQEGNGTLRKLSI